MSSIGPTLAFLTSLPVQDGGPHDFRSKMAAPTTSDPRLRPPRLPVQDGGPHDVRSKMAAPTTSGPRWRPPRHQDGGPHEIKMAVPVTRSVTPRRVSQRPRPREGSVYSRAWCRSSIYKGEGPLMYRTNTDPEESILRISGWFFYAVQNEIQSLMV